MCVRSLNDRGRSCFLCRSGGAFAGHLPESPLEFQLSFEQPLLLLEGRILERLFEASGGVGKRGFQCRPFDQQGDRFGQVFPGDLRIGAFHQEGESSVIRRRSEVTCGGYGGLPIDFKRFGGVEQGVDGLGEGGVRRR